MVRKLGEGQFSIYVPKKDLEEPIVERQNPTLWGGEVTLANGIVLDLPMMDGDVRFPITVEARKVRGDF